MQRSRFQSFEERADPSQGAPRIAALRAAFDATGIDGFLVPRADIHQNEYVPESEQRLAWLTGFTGSAGTAIVLRESAALFVDGRYTVQAPAQVDTTIFKIVNITDASPTRWLASVATKGLRIGYDPDLHTVSEVEQLAKACAECGASPIALETNLIDALWQDRPPPPLAQVVLHEERYSGETTSAKLDRLRGKLQDAKADALFTADAHAVAWAFNIRGGDVAYTPLPLSFALVPAEGRPMVFIDGRKLSNAMRDALSTFADVAEPREIERGFKGLAGKTIRLDANTTAQTFATMIERTGAALQRGVDPVVMLRAVKNPVERQGAREAHLRDGTAYARFLAWFDREAPGGKLTEIDAAVALEGFRAESPDLKNLSFDTISAAGPHAALPHYRVTEGSNLRIGEGLFLIDSGAQYLDGTTDITRTIAVGQTSAEMRDRYTRVLKGHIAISQARFPKGSTGAQIDSFARAALWEIGTDFDHGTGHGVGSYLSVHEGPQRISRLGTTPLEPGMMLSNEPGYYRVNAFGIRIETLVLVEEVEIAGAERTMYGFETLTFAPIDTRPIERSLLTSAEITWLNTYHRQVLEKIGPNVDPETLRWLERACAPIE